VDRLMERYLERPPLPELADVVRTVWIQRTGAEPYPQHHLPTGGVEIHVPIGGRPVLLGPLTGPLVELLPPHTTIIGVRFRPGAAPALPAALDELLDQRVDLAELWRVSADRLAEAVDRSATPERAVQVLQRLLLRERRRQDPADPLVQAAVLALMPWPRVEIDSLAERLALSPSQLRRRCQRVVGVPPKVLQRTLRLQGFLALAQAGAAGAGRRGMAAGYADQAHLGRKCLRLTGLTPRRLFRGRLDRCACGHDHSASYQPFLARFVQDRPAVVSVP